MKSQIDILESIDKHLGQLVMDNIEIKKALERIDDAATAIAATLEEPIPSSAPEE